MLGMSKTGNNEYEIPILPLYYTWENKLLKMVN